MGLVLESQPSHLINRKNKFCLVGMSLVAQWIRLSAHNAGVLGSISGQENRPLMPQLRPSVEIHSATTNTQHSQKLINF